MKRLQFTSFENASILRKFTIFYLLMSILPIIVLFTIYWEIKDHGALSMSPDQFALTLVLVVVGVSVGYFATRGIFRNLMEVTKTQQESLKDVIGAEKLKAMSATQDEIAILTRTFSEITSRLEENIKSLEMTKKTLHSVLAKVGQGISSMQNIDNFLELIVESLTDAMSAKTGVLMIFDEQVRDQLVVKSVYGAAQNKKGEKFKIDELVFGSVIRTRHSVIIPHLPSNADKKMAEGLFEAPIMCSPLMLHDKVLGLIFIAGRKTQEQYHDEDMLLLSNLALQTAVAVENARLNKNAEETYFETIAALAMAVEAKDPYSRGHLDRVARYCVQIAQKLNLTPQEIDTVRDAAKLHDIGKIGVTDDVLTKPGDLNPHEWEMMKRHPEIGEGIIRPIQSLRSLCDIIRHHHEKLDGTGYPDGLKDNEIGFLVRIITVADIYDALTTDRPYRRAYSVDRAKEEMRKMKTQIDQRVVEAFIQTL